MLNDNDGVTAAYKSKIRTLFVNLKDKNNPGLRESVVSGDIPVARLCKMTSSVRSFDYSIVKQGADLCRKWLLKSGRRLIKRSRKRTSSKRWAPESRRQRQMPSSAVAANRCVAYSYLLGLLNWSPVAQMPLPSSTDALRR